MIFDRTAWVNLAIGVALFVTGLVLSQTLDNYYLQVGTSLAMLCVLAMGWNFVGGYMGYPALCTVTFFGLGAYACAIARTNGVSLEMSWVLVVFVSVIAAAGLGYALLRLSGHYFAVGTIASLEVLREVANNWESVTGGAVGINLPFMEGDAQSVSQFFFLAMLGLAGLAFLATMIVDRSRFGFGLRCIRQNEEAASMVGIGVYSFKVSSFILFAAFAGLAGAIYASMVSFIEPKDAFNLIMTIEVPVMVMLGGMGTVFGPIIGAFFYVVLKELVWANFIDWHSGILGVIIVLLIYFLPGGVIGTLKRLLRRKSAPVANNAALAAAGEVK